MDAVALCPFRRDASDVGGRESATCELLATAFDSDDSRLVRVERDVCAACCRIERPADARTNPVIASLVYGRARERLLAEPAGPGSERFLRLEAEARYRLPCPIGPVNLAPEALGILSAGERRFAVQRGTGDRRLTWAVAVTTAPRRPPMLAATLASLRDAGFDDVRIFAEPGAAIPAAWSHLPVTRHSQRLGCLRNFAFAAKALIADQPGADCYAIFEDDISAARGLRRWCDTQFWPGGHGIVSLYTSRVYADDRPGWQTLNLGRYHTYGSLAFVFRPDEMRLFLSDVDVARHVARGTPNSDAIVGEWALKCDIGIAYHTPSPIQHEGRVTSITEHAMGRLSRAAAVGSVEDIAHWEPEPRRPGKVGLLGWNSPTGLGYQNRDIATLLPVDRWLAFKNLRFGRLRRPRMPGRYQSPWGQTVSWRARRRWLTGLDWVLFVERSYLHGIIPQAHDMGISVAAIPNWEWLSPAVDWVRHVDLMICPTEFTYRMLNRWRRVLGLGARLACVPWPIDASRFPFRRRERCRRFLFVNGTGGGPARRPDGSRTPYYRKGMEIIAETARLLPKIPFLVYSQVTNVPSLPANVELRRGPARNTGLYDEGDVCVQPSHWEGLGLQLLECQAAGMPLVTTDAPPMNEVRPFRAVPAAATETVFLSCDEPIDSQLVRPEDLAAVLESIYDTDIGDASERARAYIEQERSWPRVRDKIAALMPA